MASVEFRVCRRLFRGNAVVTVHNPVHLNEFNEPEHDRILIFRDPEGDQYRTSLTASLGDTFSVLAFQELIMRTEDLLG